MSVRQAYRGNLMLDELEEEVWKEALAELSTREGQPVSGAELLRRLVSPFLRRAAIRYNKPLNPPKPDDFITDNMLDPTGLF